MYFDFERVGMLLLIVSVPIVIAAMIWAWKLRRENARRENVAR